MNLDMVFAIFNYLSRDSVLEPGGLVRIVSSRISTSRQHVCSLLLHLLLRLQSFRKPNITSRMMPVMPLAAAEPPNCFMNSPGISGSGDSGPDMMLL